MTFQFRRFGPAQGPIACTIRDFSTDQQKASLGSISSSAVPTEPGQGFKGIFTNQTNTYACQVGDVIALSYDAAGTDETDGSNNDTMGCSCIGWNGTVDRPVEHSQYDIAGTETAFFRRTGQWETSESGMNELKYTAEIFGPEGTSPPDQPCNVNPGPGDPGDPGDPTPPPPQSGFIVMQDFSDINPTTGYQVGSGGPNNPIRQAVKIDNSTSAMLQAPVARITFLLRRVGNPSSTAAAAPPNATNRTGLSFTGAGYTSEYHVFAAGLDWNKKVGLLLYTDGSAEFGLKNPGDSYLLAGTNGMIAIAKKHNMVLLTPLSPNKACQDGDGSCWYQGDPPGYAAWVEALVNQIYSEYPIDTTRIAVGGYSSGAQFCTEYWVPSGGAQRTMADGVIVAISFGGKPQMTPVTFTAGFKANVHMNWNVGQNDPSWLVDDPTEGPGTGYNGKAGYDYYTANGFLTSSDIIPGTDHFRDGDFGSIMDAQIIEHVPPSTVLSPPPPPAPPSPPGNVPVFCRIWSNTGQVMQTLGQIEPSTLTNQANQWTQVPFTLQNNTYQMKIGDLIGIEFTTGNAVDHILVGGWTFQRAAEAAAAAEGGGETAAATDKFGTKMIYANTGSFMYDWELPSNSDSMRWDLTNPPINMEMTGYFMKSSPSSDTISCKIRGGKHTDSDSDAGCCYIPQFPCTGGSMQFEIECPHPNNHDCPISGTHGTSTSLAQWHGYKVVVWNTGSTVNIEAYNDTGNNSGSTPTNNWVKVFSHQDSSGNCGNIDNPLLKPKSSSSQCTFRIDNNSGVAGKWLSAVEIQPGGVQPGPGP